MEVTYIHGGMQDNLNGISIFQGLNGGFQLMTLLVLKQILSNDDCAGTVNKYVYEVKKMPPASERGSLLSL